MTRSAITAPGGRRSLEEAKPIADVGSRVGRERDHRDAVRAMFDRIAPTYDLVNRLLSAGIDARWRKQAVFSLKSMPPGEVLDVCAGTLDLSAEVERALPERRVVAVDIAADMLAAGRSKVKRTETIVADATALPFEDARFAGVVCGFGVRNLSDPKRGMEEAARVLRPGGRLVVLDFFRPSNAVTRAFHVVYARTVLPAVGAFVARDRGAYAYLARSMAAFLSRAELQAALAEIGFDDVRGEDLTFGVASIVSARKRGSA